VATPDVRIRLSAEGVAEVVNALKAIQAQSATTAAKGGSGFLGLNRILSSTASMLRSVGIAFGIREITRWIGSAVDAAVTTLRLGRQVGATTENLSGLNLIARTTGISLDEVGEYLSKMNDWVGQVMRNTPAATATLRRLGITLDDLKGKDAVQIFELLAQKISALPTIFQQTNAARDIFGRGAADLIPTLQALADEGLDRVKERARELGFLLDTKTATSLKNLKRDLELLKIQSEGVRQQFAAGVSPELSQSLQMIAGNLEGAASGWKKFGDALGWVVKLIVGGVSEQIDFLSTHVRMLWIELRSVAEAAKAGVRGDWEEVRRIMRQADADLAREEKGLLQRSMTRARLLLTPTASTGEWQGPSMAPGPTPEEEGARVARLQAAQAALDRELALVKITAALKNAAEKRAFEQGLEGVTSYYANRIRIANEAYDAEVAGLEKKRRLAGEEPDAAKRAAEQAKIDDDLAKLKIEHEGEILAIQGEELQAVRELGRERLALDQRILESEGQRHAAAMLGIEAEIAKAEELSRRLGETDDERAARAERLRATLTAGLDFDEAKRQAEAALSALDAARSEIQARVSAGLLSQVQGEQQILDIEKDRLIILQELAGALEAAAAATGDPEKIAQAQSFSASIRELALGVTASEDAWARFRTTALDSATSALATFFDTGISGSRSLAEAFGNMVNSIVADLQRFTAELIAKNIMGWITELFSGGGEVGKKSSGAMPAAHAGGGLIRGPGTGTSDSIFARVADAGTIRVSDHEFIVRAAVVAQPGMLQHLEDLNMHGAQSLISTPMMIQRPIPSFAAGGLVEAGSKSNEAGGAATRLILGLDDGLILRHMESPPGQRIIVGAVAKNKRTVKAVLGDT
jgi:hypothetical protein